MASDLYEIIFLMKVWMILRYLSLIIQIYISEYNKKLISFEINMLIYWVIKWEPTMCLIVADFMPLDKDVYIPVWHFKLYRKMYSK